MKRIKNRAAAVLLIAALIAAGVGYYCVRLALDGGSWIAFSGNRAVFNAGVMASGTVVDRNGVMLAGVSEEGRRVFAAAADVREATLHAVGDGEGKIGTGALTVFAPRLIGYNFLTGIYSRSETDRTVALSIAARLNLAAYRALDGRHGTVGVINYETGELLCMVSSPAYDPAAPPVIAEDNPQFDGVYVNRFLSSVYVPGSVFKLVTAAAAIENIDGILDRSFTCTGRKEIHGELITCPDAHGELTFPQALAQSCNIAFSEIALELGGKTISNYVNNMGLAARQSVSGIRTAAGRFDVAAADSAPLAWSGVGQYNDLINPASFLRFVAAVASGGMAADMRLTADGDAGGKTRMLDRQTAQTLAGMMRESAVSYGEGRFPGLELYAKSGTAEVGGGLPPHSWFAGFIRNEGFPYAFVVMIENGGSGTANAGAVANAVLQKAILP